LESEIKKQNYEIKNETINKEFENLKARQCLEKLPPKLLDDLVGNTAKYFRERESVLLGQ
jgi:hypothetical protein